MAAAWPRSVSRDVRRWASTQAFRAIARSHGRKPARPGRKPPIERSARSKAAAVMSSAWSSDAPRASRYR